MRGIARLKAGRRRRRGSASELALRVRVRVLLVLVMSLRGCMLCRVDGMVLDGR